jgi:hypothetical protein
MNRCKAPNIFVALKTPEIQEDPRNKQKIHRGPRKSTEDPGEILKTRSSSLPSSFSRSMRSGVGFNSDTRSHHLGRSTGSFQHTGPSNGGTATLLPYGPTRWREEASNNRHREAPEAKPPSQAPGSSFPSHHRGRQSKQEGKTYRDMNIAGI